MDAARLLAALAIVISSVLVVPAPANAAVPGYFVTSSVTVSNSTSPKTVSASCGSGKVLIGGGYYVDGVVGQIVVDRVLPTTSAMRVTAYEAGHGTPANWWLRAFAICASNILSGHQIVSVTSSPGSDSTTLTATCPSGKSTFGVGAAVTGGNGQVILRSLLASTSSVTAHAVEDNDGTANTWSLTTYAICAYYLPGMSLVDTQTMSDTADQQAVSSSCGQGKIPLSVGWHIQSRNTSPAALDVAMPTTTGGVIVAHELSPDTTTSWMLAARWVCALSVP